MEIFHMQNSVYTSAQSDLDSFDISSQVQEYDSLTYESALAKAAEVYMMKRQCFWSHLCMTRSDSLLGEVETLINLFPSGTAPSSRVRTSLIQAKMALVAAKEDLARQRVLDIGNLTRVSKTHTAKASFIPAGGNDIRLKLPVGWKSGETVVLEVAGIRYEFVPPPECQEGEELRLNPMLMTLTRSLAHSSNI